MCCFYVVSGNRQPLPGMSDIKTLGILTINCNTIELQETDDLQNHKAYMRQEIDTTEKHYTNTDSSKSENEDKPVVNNNNNNNNNNSINYFFPGLNSDANKKASDEITQWLQRVQRCI